ncbi:L-xylulose 5-phosphate 3-epimerase [Vallitalea longa]|uniref:L-xylulose 5-phosphate 3-epimerase n=2 Tax=Vallitalea longa TaxID=2936439 RepID=A0A9W6DFK6_9FIRM|nr:L-xylulose 5-phosphate 3-epimerase [Vallitalea longa]
MLPVKEEEAFSFAKELGFMGLALELKYYDGKLNLSDENIQKKYLASAKDNGIVIPTFAVNALCDYGMSKKANKEIVFDIIDQAIMVAKNMSVMTLQFPSFFDGEISSEEEFDNTRICLEYACEKVKGTGIKIGWENAVDEEKNKTMLDSINSEDFFIYYDTQNPIRCSNLDNVDLARQLLSHIKEIHAKDSLEDVTVEVQLGEGTTNFEEVMEVFRDNDYTGWILLESEYKAFDNYVNIIKKDKEFMNDFWGR